MSSRPRIVPLHTPTYTAAHLYCFTPAGSGPSAYRSWAALLPDDIRLSAILLPGHENHPTRLPHTNPDVLARDIAILINTARDEKAAFFGHSVGALLAFETTRHLGAADRPLPVLLALSGLPAVHHEKLHENMRTVVYDGVGQRPDMAPFRPENNPGPEANAFYAAALADTLLVLNYRYRDEPRLEVPFALYAGQDDTLVTYEALAAWSDHTLHRAEPRFFPGDHYYLVDSAPALVKQLVHDIREAVA